ncbi:MAG: NAD(P)-dependent oxidoreductase [Gammaproteobacteria bacterium]|nr:NAD(P)-dependent oxidoreductase [Gammaproteobacteria bacterium]
MTTPAVTVLGLGRMGQAIAGCFARGGVRVTAWNRTEPRPENVPKGVTIAPSPSPACLASPTVVVCVSDYAAAERLLAAPAVAAALAGRTLVQLTSGTPADARRLASWAGLRGIEYLDGAIMSYPESIGGAKACLVYSGPLETYERLAPLLGVLGGETRFVGAAVGAAAGIDCALLEAFYGATFALLHGAALCASEGIGLPSYFAALKEIQALGPLTGDIAQAMIADGSYSGGQATLAVHVAAIENIARFARENRVAPGIPLALLEAGKAAIAGGHRSDEIAAVFEVFRKR